MTMPPITPPPALELLIEREMKRGSCASPEALLQTALEHWAEHRETLAVLESALDEVDAGQAQPWAEVDREFRQRNGLADHG